MTRQLLTHLSLLLVALTLFTGCHSTQPFYFNDDCDLSHYLDQATDLEHPDVNEPRLPEVDNAHAPLTLSDPEPKEMWDISLEEAIAITLENSKVIRTRGAVSQSGTIPAGVPDLLLLKDPTVSTIYDPAIQETSVSDGRLGVEAALSAFDTQLNILGTSNGNFFNRTDRPSTFGGGSIVDQTTGGLRTELSKRSAGGTQFFARNITEYTRGNTILGFAQPIDSIWQTTMELEVRQPILQNRGALINRVFVIQARINTDIALADFEADVRDLLLEVEQTYWDLHFAYRNLETARIGRDSAQTTWKIVYTKFSEGVQSAQEEQQTREQYFDFKAQIETALRDLYSAEGRLRFHMGLSPSDGRLIRPLDEPTTARVEFDWHAIHKEALVRSAELRRQKWSIQASELQLMAAKNLLLPQFDLGATYRWFGMGDQLINADRNGLNFPAIGSTASDVLTEGNFQEAAFFMQFQMPVGFRRALSGVRNAQLQLARDKARLEDQELNLSHLLTAAIRNLDANHRLVQTQFMRWSAAIEEVETTLSLYPTKISLDQMLEAQRRRAFAQRDYYRALTEYNKSIADVHFRKGSLLEYNNVHLAEGPWPEKAYWDALGHARQRDASYYMDYGWSRPRVVSQGPIEQHMGGAYQQDEEPAEMESLEGPTPSEPMELPPPMEPMGKPPTTPDEAPEAPRRDETKPRRSGPITSRPDQPQLNGPLLRAESMEESDGKTAQHVPSAFDWGPLVIESASQRIENPLRQVSHVDH